MNVLMAGLLLALLFHAVFFLILVVAALLFPGSTLSETARSAFNWMPPFLGGKALRDWAAAAAEEAAQKHLAGKRTGETVTRLAMEMEDASMHAMLPLMDAVKLERIVACPETGQGHISVTAPEVFAIVADIRRHKSHAEQKRIYEQAVANAKYIASRAADDPTPLPCALKGTDHVCCTYARRPLLCRPLHAIAIADDTSRGGQSDRAPTSSPGEPRHEQLVAEGVETGMTRALKSAGLDANVYELNSALATALEIPDAAERWSRGEVVFRKASS